MSHVIKEVACVLGITLKHATTELGETNGLLQRSHSSIKQALKIETVVRRSLWHKYVGFEVLTFNTSYHASIGCEPSRVIHECIPYHVLDFKIGIRLQKIPYPGSQMAQDVLEQTEMIFRDVRKNAMQAYIKHKAYYDKKTNASNFKQPDYVYVLQPKADHQVSKILFTDFRWIGPYVIENVLPNNGYLVSKIGTNETQVLHRMRLRQFAPHQPIPDIQIIPCEWKPDTEVIIKYDDLYARAWECEYEKAIFDSDYNNPVSPNSPEITVRSKEAADETRSTPGTIRERIPQKLLLRQTDRMTERTRIATCNLMRTNTSIEQLDPMPTNPHSSKIDLRHKPKPNCNDENRY